MLFNDCVVPMNKQDLAVILAKKHLKRLMERKKKYFHKLKVQYFKTYREMMGQVYLDGFFDGIEAIRELTEEDINNVET